MLKDGKKITTERIIRKNRRRTPSMTCNEESPLSKTRRIRKGISREKKKRGSEPP